MSGILSIAAAAVLGAYMNRADRTEDVDAWRKSMERDAAASLPYVDEIGYGRMRNRHNRAWHGEINKKHAQKLARKIMRKHRK